MAGLIDEFMKSYGHEVTRQLSSSFKVDQGIGSLLDADGDGSILDDVAGYLMKGGSQTGTPTKGKSILGSLLGGLTRRR